MTEQLTDTTAIEPAAAVRNGSTPAVRRRLTREDVQAVDDVQRKDLDVPEWGGFVTVQGMTGSQRDAWEASLVTNPGTPKQRVKLADARARMCVWTCVDEHGRRVFSEDDIPWLTRKSAAALERVFDVARKLSGLTDSDLEEIEADLKGDPSAGTG